MMKNLLILLVLLFICKISTSQDIYECSNAGGQNCCHTSASTVILTSDVTYISTNAFSGCSFSMTTIVVPSSVNNIEMNAFHCTSSLRTISIASDSTAIFLNGILQGCSGLTTIIAPSSSMVEKVLTLCQQGVQDTSYNNGDGLKKYNIQPKTSVVIPDSLTWLGWNFLQGCSLIVTSVVIPSTVTSIGMGAFYQSTTLTSVTINSESINIGDSAFYECNRISTVIAPSQAILDRVIPVCKKGTMDANYNVNGLKKYTITTVKDVVIPSSINYISDDTLRGCKSIMTSVLIPSTVSMISNTAFQDCPKLTTFIVSSPSVLNQVLSSCQQGIEDASYDSSATGLKKYKIQTLTTVVIPDGVGMIDQNTLRGCNSVVKTVVIPSSVASIGSSALGSFTSLTSVVVPSTVRHIDNYAFSSCSSLTSITISSDTTLIGDNIVAGCPKLTTIIAPSSSVLSKLLSLCQRGIEDTNYSSSATGLKKYTVQKLTSTVEIPDGITYFGQGVLHECSTTVKSLTIPSSVTYIDRYALLTFHWLTSVVILCGVSAIPDGLFAPAGKLTTVIVPESLELSRVLPLCKQGIQDTSYTTAGLKKYTIHEVTSVVLPDGYSYISSSTFSGCGSIVKSVVIPISVTDIWQNAFEGLTSLTSVAISNNNINIYSGVFQKCTKLTTIIAPSSSVVDKILSICQQGVEDTNYSSIDTGMKKYNIEPKTSVIVPGSLPIADRFIFEGCESVVTSIVVPSTVSIIGDNAFLDYTSLTSLTISSSTTTIGDGIVQGCSKLATVIAPSSSVLKKVLQLCQKGVQDTSYKVAGLKKYTIQTLTSVVLPSSVTTIGKFRFASCRSMTSVVIPSSVTIIENEAFEYCSSLKAIVIPSSVTIIGFYAFAYCTSLRSLVIPSSVNNLGGYFAIGCSSLGYISIPASVSSIGPGSMTGCGSLTTVILPSTFFMMLVQTSLTLCQSATVDTSYDVDGLTKYNIKHTLTSLVIPENVASIGDWAYAGCTTLKSVVIPSSIISIGRSAFESCTSLKSVSIPNSVTTLGNGAFRDCPITCINGWNSSVVRDIGTDALPTTIDCAAVRKSPSKSPTRKPTRKPTPRNPRRVTTRSPSRRPTTINERTHSPSRRPTTINERTHSPSRKPTSSTTRN